jgi:hypothetical protein
MGSAAQPLRSGRDRAAVPPGMRLELESDSCRFDRTSTRTPSPIAIQRSANLGTPQPVEEKRRGTSFTGLYNFMFGTTPICESPPPERPRVESCVTTAFSTFRANEAERP